MTTDVVGYAQNSFESALEEAKTGYSKINNSARIRRICAYTAKSIGVFGGLAIGSGLFSAYAQFIGLAVAAVITLDALFSNQVRMVLETEAAQAFLRLATDARRIHIRELQPILFLKKTEPEKSENQLLDLLRDLTKRLHSGCQAVEDSLDAGDLKALKALSLESEQGKPFK